MEKLFCHGGIYGIYFEDILLYVGKTTNDFNNRFSAHKNNINNKDRTEKFYQYCYDNNISSDMLSFKTLFDCKSCPLSSEQIECLETNYINDYHPLYNEKKIDKQDTILSFPELKFSMLNKEQQAYILYLYQNLSKSAFGIALISLFFNEDVKDRDRICSLLNIKKTAYYTGINELKQLQIKGEYHD